VENPLHVRFWQLDTVARQKLLKALSTLTGAF
jgi:hypothetical protein